MLLGFDFDLGFRLLIFDFRFSFVCEFVGNARERDFHHSTCEMRSQIQ